MDSMICPRSQHGHTSALIIVDSCTGYVICYPSTNLQASSVRKHLLTYLSSHPIPEEIKCDFGSEFRKDLDTFLAKYGTKLNASKPFSKGSSSNAESAIKLSKGGLRQLCLSHTSNWPELVPLLIQGINSTGLYGTSTTRQMLYFSPYSYSNILKLDGLLWPEVLFNEHFDQLKRIVQRRKKSLQKRKVLDKTMYQPGNLVLAVNHPVSATNETKGKSQELSLTTRGIYYVVKVCPAHLRLVGLFTGETRNMPREFVVKLTLDNLTKIQTFLQSHQLQKVSNSLFCANKFLGPNEAKTWSYLLDKNQNHDNESEYFDEDLDTSSDSLTRISADDLTSPARDTSHHTLSTKPASDTLSHEIAKPQPLPAVQPQGKNRNRASEILQPSIEDVEPGQRTRMALRFGRAYWSMPDVPVRSILKKPASESQTSHLTPLPSQQENSFQSDQVLQDTFSDPPGHETKVTQYVEKSDRKIEFKDQLQIRFTTGKDIREFSQQTLFHTETHCPIPPQSYLMLSSIGVDTSLRELVYTATWSKPSSVNDPIFLPKDCSECSP